MRRYLALSIMLPLAACAMAPRQTAAPAAAGVQQQPVEQNSLVGLTPQELVSRFGAPALQIREAPVPRVALRARRLSLSVGNRRDDAGDPCRHAAADWRGHASGGLHRSAWHGRQLIHRPSRSLGDDMVEVAKMPLNRLDQ